MSEKPHSVVVKFGTYRNL